MDAIAFLKQEHETARQGFARVTQASGQARGALWRKLRPELEVHEQIEEACVYAPVGDDAEGRDAQLTEWNQQHARDVEAAKRLMEAIDAMNPEDEQWPARIAELSSALERHIAVEEEQIFPRLALVWNRDRLDRAGGDLERMKQDRLSRAA